MSTPQVVDDRLLLDGVVAVATATATAGTETGTTTAATAAVTAIDSLLSLPSPPNGLCLTEEEQEQQEREEMVEFTSSQQQQQQHMTIRTNNDYSFFPSSIRYDDHDDNDNVNDMIDPMMIHELYGLDISSGTATTATGPPPVPAAAMEDAGTDPGFLLPPLPLPMSFQSQYKSEHEQQQMNNEHHGSALQHQQPPAVASIPPAPPSQSTLTTIFPQSLQQQQQQLYQQHQQQQQYSSQPMTSALPMCQLLTSLNQLAAVSTTPQDVQAVLQVAAAMSLAQVTTNQQPASYGTSTNSSSYGSFSQQQQQQQKSEASHQQMMQQWIALQQLCQLQQLQAGQGGIVNDTSHASGCEMASPLSTMQQQPLSPVMQTQQQPQPQHPPSIDSTSTEQQTSTAVADRLHDQSHLQHSNTKKSHEHTTNVSKNTTTILNNNNTDFQPVQITTDQSADAMTDKTTIVKVNHQDSSSVNAHTDDSKNNENNTNAISNNPIMDGKQPVHTQQQQNSLRTGTSTTKGTTTSPQPSIFPSRLDYSGKPHSTGTDCELTMTTSKKENPPFVNNNATKTSRTEPGTTNNNSNFQCTDDVSKEQETSKSVSNDDNNGDIQKIPACTIILPCRARGMPSDHNFKNAHFVIPPDIQHGQELVCSHAACRQRGNKFRYCLECSIPVAKRNFNQRHGHGLVAVTNATGKAAVERPTVPRAAMSIHQDDDRSANETKTATVGDGLGRLLAAARMDAHPGPIKESHQNLSRDIVKTVDGHKVNCNLKPEENVNDVDQPSLTSSGASSTDSDSTGAPMGVDRDAVTRAEGSLVDGKGAGDVSSSRQLRWATLLEKRPDEDDDDGMSAWLLEVMEVSDAKTPLASRHRLTQSYRTDSARNQVGKHSSTIPSSDKMQVDHKDDDTESEDSSMDQKMSRRRRRESPSLMQSATKTKNQGADSESCLLRNDADSDPTTGRRTSGFKRKLPSYIVCGRSDGGSL